MSPLFVTVLIVAVVGVLAAPQQPIQPISAFVPASDVTPIPIIDQTDTNNGDGSFSYSYESGNGIKTSGQGFLKKIFVPVVNEDGVPTGKEEEKEIVVQTGSYSYPAPDGEIITINYVADENGFQPTGDHIPTPPAIPEQIIKSLQQQAAASSNISA